MLTYPNAKINLGLHIVEKRADGFHNIETIFYPIKGLRDILEIILSKNGKTTLTNTGLLIDTPESSNLCVKAWGLLNKDYAISPVDIYLHKQIPFGAGLGGGSADAAYSLMLLNGLFNLNLSIAALKEYALRLGSDCSFFMENKPILAKGRGERLENISLSLKGKYIAIIHPAIRVGTARAYAGAVPKPSDFSLITLPSLPLREWRLYLKNDFEESIFKAYPQIAEIKAKLYEKGAIYAAMSGSGSSVFGVFEELPDISKTFSNYHTYSGMLED
ncbi:MAG: 4-(cytidine 5'-diphospho)-2-C-methyl-D-erythritol kinase [Prevotellaceae bacterium]|jgi:4-diphosphocytidyl-2-C-methyl-D-erythritol kinase|nr:4-(cytidine 5'-diphospho)-2-C-methyl-D-erythritol kinase [Prevotellaceae bacterium]